MFRTCVGKLGGEREWFNTNQGIITSHTGYDCFILPYSLNSYVQNYILCPMSNSLLILRD